MVILQTEKQLPPAPSGSSFPPQEPPAYQEGPSNSSFNHFSDVASSSRSPTDSTDDVDFVSGPFSPPVNGLRISSQFKDIRGTYKINTALPPTHAQSSKDAENQNAMFVTRNGDVKVDLQVVGPDSDTTKARINVSTMKGNITATLLPMHSSRHVHLELLSRKGTITLLVPRSFSGVVSLRTGGGAIAFLPAMAAHMSPLKITAQESLIMVGSPHGPGSAIAVDYCELLNRGGKVQVGLAGEDHVEEPKPGPWQKFGGYLKKNLSGSPVDVKEENHYETVERTAALEATVTPNMKLFMSTN